MESLIRLDNNTVLAGYLLLNGAILLVLAIAHCLPGGAEEEGRRETKESCQSPAEPVRPRHRGKVANWPAEFGTDRVRS
jgi:hypothetical protein